MAENNIENSKSVDNIESVADILDAKLKELKIDLINEFKIEILALVNEHKKQVEKLESTVSILQKHVSYLKRDNVELSKQCDENEQYGRHLCLRIEGVPVGQSGKETADDVFNIVKDLISEAEVEIPTVVLDRAKI